MSQVIFCAFILVAGSAFGQSLNPAQQTAAIQAVREYALTYTKALPNYTCTQITREEIVQYPPAIESNLIEEQLSFTGDREIRKVTKINGRKASPNGRDQLMGTPSRGEFGNLLENIFDPRSGADVRFDRVTTRSRRRVYVFAFTVPQSSGYVLTETKRRIRVPFKGFVYADAETNAVLRIEMQCANIPAGSEYYSASVTLDYKPATIAGRTFILPAHSAAHYYMVGGRETNDSDYKAYRRFSADEAVTFEGQAR